jgi:hypothetical protein
MKNLYSDNFLTETTTTDDRKDIIKVWTNTQLAGSRAMPLFLKTYAEIMEKDFGRPFMACDDINKLDVVFCTDVDDNVLGGITWTYKELFKEGWMILSFTDPKHRGRRINEVCHIYLEKMVRERGGDKIGSYVNINNATRLRSIERTGMKPQFYRMAKYI